MIEITRDVLLYVLMGLVTVLVVLVALIFKKRTVMQELQSQLPPEDERPPEPEPLIEPETGETDAFAIKERIQKESHVEKMPQEPTMIEKQDDEKDIKEKLTEASEPAKEGIKSQINSVKRFMRPIFQRPGGEKQSVAPSPPASETPELPPIVRKDIPKPAPVPMPATEKEEVDEFDYRDLDEYEDYIDQQKDGKPAQKPMPAPVQVLTKVTAPEKVPKPAPPEPPPESAPEPQVIEQPAQAPVKAPVTVPKPAPPKTPPEKPPTPKPVPPKTEPKTPPAAKPALKSQFLSKRVDFKEPPEETLGEAFKNGKLVDCIKASELIKDEKTFVNQTISMEGELQLSSKGNDFWYVLFDDTGSAVIRSEKAVAFKKARVTAKVEKTRLGQIYLNVIASTKI